MIVITMTTAGLRVVRLPQQLVRHQLVAAYDILEPILEPILEHTY